MDHTQNLTVLMPNSFHPSNQALTYLEPVPSKTQNFIKYTNILLVLAGQFGFLLVDTEMKLQTNLYSDSTDAQPNSAVS